MTDPTPAEALVDEALVVARSTPGSYRWEASRDALAVLATEVDRLRSALAERDRRRDEIERLAALNPEDDHDA